MIGAACVYIMASQRNGTLYLGSTMDLPKRAWEHHNGVVEGFTKRHGCHLLVWYEVHDSREAARQRELQMKEWRRSWKLQEIEGVNPRLGRPVRSDRAAMTAFPTGPRRTPGW